MKCPTCGNEDGKSPKLQHNRMSEYVVDATNETFGVLNSDEDYLTIKGVKYRKKGVKQVVATANTVVTAK